MLPTPEGANADLAHYTLLGVLNTFRVNANNTTTDLVEITAQSDKYGVVFTWDISLASFNADGAANAAQQKVTEVNQLAAYDHVYAMKTEQDQDKSGVLYNYMVVTVGTDDGSITTDVQVRMDSIGLPSAFGAVDDAWARLVALGAPKGG